MTAHVSHGRLSFPQPCLTLVRLGVCSPTVGATGLDRVLRTYVGTLRHGRMVPVFFGDHLEVAGRAALPLAAFVTWAVITIGALGSLVGRYVAGRWERTNFTVLMLAISGVWCLGIGLLWLWAGPVRRLAIGRWRWVYVPMV